MRATPIPDTDLEHYPNGTRVVLGAPITGDLTDPTIAPLELLFHPTELANGVHTLGATTRWVPSPDELETLNAGGAVYLTIIGTDEIHPLAMEIR